LIEMHLISGVELLYINCYCSVSV